VLALLDHRPPPGPLDVVLQLHAERPVVPHRVDPAVDLGRRVNEAASLRHRHDRGDVVDGGRDGVGVGRGRRVGHGRAISGASSWGRPFSHDASQGLDRSAAGVTFRSIDRIQSCDRPAPVATEAGRMGYESEGRLLEVCTCNVLCPCWVGENPDYETCDTTIAWGIEKGTIEGVDASGLPIPSSAHIPENILIPKAWKAAVFIDDRSTDAQQDALIK